MTLPARELLMEVSKLTELRSMKVALKESVKAACITGVVTMFGGIILGPAGIAIGGIIGGCTASYLAQNKFRPVPEIIIYDLTMEQKVRLAAAIQKCLTSVDLKDMAQFAVKVAQDPTISHTVVMTVMTFLQSEMQMKIVD